MGSLSQNAAIAAAIDYFGTQVGLAAAIGSSQSTVSRLLLGETRVNAELAVMIDKITSGTISKSRLRPDLWSQEPAKMGVIGPPGGASRSFRDCQSIVEKSGFQPSKIVNELTSKAEVAKTRNVQG